VVESCWEVTVFWIISIATHPFILNYYLRKECVNVLYFPGKRRNSGFSTVTTEFQKKFDDICALLYIYTINSLRRGSMKKSFYHFLMKFRGDQNRKLASLVNEIYMAHDFPKQSENYDEISTYLELHSTSIHALSIFDEIWEIYQLDELKVL
jgi:uncharacterized protein YozE (UPF0346 family)